MSGTVNSRREANLDTNRREVCVGLRKNHATWIQALLEELRATQTLKTPSCM